MQQIPASAYFTDGPPPPPPDRDGDGVSDAEELIAGTNPDDAKSFLQIKSISKENENIVLRWAGIAGRTYRIQESDDLEVWVSLLAPGPLVITESIADAFVTIPGNGEPKRYFRVVASITPPQPPSDRDGDGSSDADEAIDGTNPDDPRSFFKIKSSSISESGMQLGWEGVAGRTYQVEESPDLTTWALVPGVAPAVVTSATPNATMTVPDNGHPRRFLRMQVILTP